MGYKVNRDAEYLFQCTLTTALQSDASFIIILPPESDTQVRQNYNSIDCFQMVNEQI